MRGRRRSLIVLAILAGVLFVLVSLAPPFASAFGRGYAEDYFNERHQGRLEIGGLDLAWTGRQRVRDARLYAPGGELVARLSAEVPSLLVLGLRGSRDLGQVSVRGTADLRADDDGSTNLDRALAPRVTGELAQGGEGQSPAPEQGGDSAGLRPRELNLTIELQRLTWEDASTRAAGTPLAFEDVRAQVGMAWDGTITAQAELLLQGGAGDGLNLDLAVHDAFPEQAAELPTRFDLSMQGKGMPVGVLDGLSRSGGLLLEAMGQKADFELRALGTMREGRVNLVLSAERASARLGAEVANGMLRIEQGSETFASLRPRSELFERLSEEHLPDGKRIDPLLEGSRFELHLRELELPLGEAPIAIDPAHMLATSSARLELVLPPLAFAESRGRNDRGARRLAAERLTLRLTLDPQSGLALELDGTLEGAARDGLQLALRHARPAALLDWSATGGLEPALELEGRVAGLPTDWLDTYADQDGLLIDVLGDSLDVTFRGRHPDPSAPLVLALRSPQASLDLEANLSDGTLSAGQEGAISLSSGLTPLYKRRIVGPMLPLLVGLKQPQGAEPVGLRVEDFVLPLDGDLSLLSAKVTLDLHQVSYELLPGLDAWVPRQGAEGKQRTVELEPIQLVVESGKVRYERAGLELNGHPIELQGSFELASKRLDLTTELPLSALGSDVTSQLDKLRDYVPATTAVPLRLGGSWRAPRISIGEGFSDSLLEGAKEAAVQKGLESIFKRVRRDD